MTEIKTVSAALIDSIDFQRFIKLKELFTSANFNALNVVSLTLTYQKSTQLPPRIALAVLPNLRKLDLSHNEIDRFEAQTLVTGAPNLEFLDLSHNRITTTEDLGEVGRLKNLQALNVLANPITEQISRLQMITQLMFIEKYAPYNPVSVLTAGYTYISIKKPVKVEVKDLLKKLERKVWRKPLDPEIVLTKQEKALKSKE
jgi:Leucine-rich repeat (LRR) protein